MGSATWYCCALNKERAEPASATKILYVPEDMTDPTNPLDIKENIDVNPVVTFQTPWPNFIQLILPDGSQFIKGLLDP